MPNLTIVRGLPGSGKSTLAQRVYPNHVLVETDQFFTDENGNYTFDIKRMGDAIAWAQMMVEHNLSQGKDTITTGVFTQIWQIEPYIEMAFNSGATIRISEVNGKFESIHNVPKEAVRCMASRWEELNKKALSEKYGIEIY